MVPSPLYCPPDLHPIISVIVAWDVFHVSGSDIFRETQHRIVQLLHVSLYQLRESPNAKACGLRERTPGFKSRGGRGSRVTGVTPIPISIFFRLERAQPSYLVYHLPRGNEQLTGERVDVQCIPNVRNQQLEGDGKVGEPKPVPTNHPSCESHRRSRQGQEGAACDSVPCPVKKARPHSILSKASSRPLLPSDTRSFCQMRPLGTSWDFPSLWQAEQHEQLGWGLAMWSCSSQHTSEEQVLEVSQMTQSEEHGAGLLAFTGCICFLHQANIPLRGQGFPSQGGLCFLTSA